MTSRADIPPVMCLRDTREELPLSPHVLRVYRGEAVREYLHTRDVGLDAGDYALAGFEDLLFIERKSPGDLWSSLFGKAPDNSVGEAMFNIDRLRREFFRARDRVRKVLLIEVDLGSFEEPRPMLEETPRTMVAYARQRYERNGRRGRSPEENVLSIVELLASFWCDYGVTPLWAGSRRGAELWLGLTMTRMWDEAHGGPKADVARGRGLALPWMPVAGAGGRVHDEGETLAEPDGDRDRPIGGGNVDPGNVGSIAGGAGEGAHSLEAAACPLQPNGRDVAAVLVAEEVRAPTPEAPAVLACSCGTPALPASHPRAAPGCCYSATPHPAPVAGSQERASLDGLRRVRIMRSAGRLWCVRLAGSPDGWNTAAVIEREWPVLCDPAAPWVRSAAPPDAGVTRVLAGRDLLGVALTYGEHAQRKRARRGRVGA